MDATGENDALALGNVVLRALEVRNDKHFEAVAGERLAQRGSSEESLAVRQKTDRVQETVAVRVGVRVAHRDVDLVVVVFQREFEAQCVKIRRLFLVHTHNLTGCLSCEFS